jgi:hypothetical protein
MAAGLGCAGLLHESQIVTPDPSPTAKRPSRLGLYFVPGLIALLTIGATAWWFVAARFADQGFDRWIASEGLAGRHWDCPSRSIGGFPFRIELRCDGFAMNAESGAIKTLSLGGFVAVAQSYDPNHVLVDLASPLKAGFSDGMAATLSWSTMRTSLHLVNAIRADRVSWSADGMALETSNPLVSGTLTHAEFHLRKTGAEGDQGNDLETVFAADGVKSTGNDLPAVFQAHLFNKKGWIAAENPTLSGIEAWRAAGGELVIDQWDLKRGDQNLSLKGTIGLDEAHRLAGRLDVSASGLGEWMKSSGFASFGGAFGAGQVALPLSFVKGRVMVGPLKLVELPPFY